MRRGVAVALVLVAGCGHGSAPVTEKTGTVHARLPSGTAAVVGGVAIPVSLVAEVARAERLEPKVALERLVADALVGEGARAAGEDRDRSTAWELESIVARSLARQLRVASLAAGPPTDAEVAELTAKYWRDVDLPEQLKVVHAIVLHPKDPSQHDAARALAAQLSPALGLATSEEDFEVRAKAVPAGPFDIRVEHLPAFVQDGRTAEGDPGLFDAAFVRGAFVLKRPGETSGVVESADGWHVIRLVERRRPKIVPLEERRARFAEEVYARRGHDALVAVLTRRRSATHIEPSPNAEAVMATVSSSAAP